MTGIIKSISYALHNAIGRMINHDGVEHAGYMSFMVMLSIFPFCIFLLAFTSFIGASELGTNFIDLVLEHMPDYSINAIKVQITDLEKSPPQGFLTLAIAGSIWTASSYVECLRTILNRVYEISALPHYVLRRLLSVLQFLLISLIITFAMFLLVILPIAIQKAPAIMDLIRDYKFPLNVTRYILIFLSLFFTSCSLYYIIPNVRMPFLEVVPGALLTVLLWILSGYGLSIYISYFNQINLVYGSIASIIITMIFFYIINMIFIYGAEFNYLLSKSLKNKENRGENA